MELPGTRVFHLAVVVLLFLLITLFGLAEVVSSAETGEARQDVVDDSTSHSRKLMGKLINCGAACGKRCSHSKNHQHCIKNCTECCRDCNCVPLSQREYKKYKKAHKNSHYNCSCYKSIPKCP